MEMTRVTPTHLNDDEAFAQCFHQYKNMVFKTAYLLLDSSDDAEDVLQEVFVQAHRHRKRYDPAKAAMSTWLHKITVNLCLSRRRKTAWRAWITQKTGGLWASPYAPSPEDGLGDTVVREALKHLSDELRTILVLRFYHELEYQEIAEILDIPLGTAKSRVNYALSVLRQQFEAQELPETFTQPREAIS